MKLQEDIEIVGFVLATCAGSDARAAFARIIISSFVVTTAPRSDWAPEVAQAYALIVERLRLLYTPHDATWRALSVVQTALRGIGPRDRLDGPRHERLAQQHTRARVDIEASIDAGCGDRGQLNAALGFYPQPAEALEAARAEQESWEKIEAWLQADSDDVRTLEFEWIDGLCCASFGSLASREIRSETRAEAIAKAAEWCEANK